MAALAANAVKSQRRKAANKLAEQALSNINEQRQFLATVAQKHRDSLSSVSTLDSYRQYEVKKNLCCGLKIQIWKKNSLFLSLFSILHTMPKVQFLSQKLYCIKT